MIIRGMFAGVILFVFSIYTISFFALMNKWKMKMIIKSILISISYICLIIVAFFPMPLEIEESDGGGINFIPFKTIGGYIIGAVKDGMVETAIYQIVGNILMFYFLMLMTFMVLNEYNTRKKLIILFCTAISVEAFQAFISVFLGFLYRSIDIDDVILYLLGGALALLTLSYKKE